MCPEWETSEDRERKRKRWNIAIVDKSNMLGILGRLGCLGGKNSLISTFRDLESQVLSYSMPTNLGPKDSMLSLSSFLTKESKCQG